MNETRHRNEVDLVIELDREWEDAIIARDVETMERLASDDLVYTHASCAVDDKAIFLLHIADGPLRFVEISYDDIAVRLTDTTAVLTCELHLRTLDRDQRPGELHFRTTHVWVKEVGHWRLLANQSTHMPWGIATDDQ